MKPPYRKPSEVDLHVARKIAERRVSMGMSQAALAKHLGVTQQGVDRYERAASRIPVGRFFVICQALQCAPDEMFEGLEVPRLEPRRKNKTVEGLLALAESYLLDGAPHTAADCLRDALRECLLIADRKAAVLNSLINEDMDVV